MAYEFGVISADSHLTITNAALLSHVPERHQDAAKDYLAARTGGSIGSSGTSQQSENERFWPALGRKGQYDPLERLKDMDTDGIDVEVLYTQGDKYMMPAGDPPGIDGMELLGIDDDPFRYVMIKAFNDALGDWIDTAPDRLVPMGIVPLLPLETAVSEIERLANRGFKGVRISAIPPAGEPPFWNERWNPLWEAAVDHAIPIHLHLGAGLDSLENIDDPLPGRPLYKSLPPLMMSQVLGAFVIYGPAKTFPKLKIGLVEAGIGWIPYYLERLDNQWERHAYRERHGTSEPPSSYWHRNFFATFEEDQSGIRCLDLLGPSTVMWASDYPHPDCTWPESQKVIDNHFSKIPPDQKRLVTFENAQRIYRLPEA
jgi:predicted TIM-barrel fold metal-dependent hydrolase